MHTKKRIFKLLIIAVIFAFLAANSKSIASSARMRFTEIFTPLLKSFKGMSLSVKKIIPFASLREENRALRQRLSLYERRFEEMKMLARENDRLKGLIDFRKNIPYTAAAAQVIGRDPANWSNSLILDKGQSSGVKGNKAVISVRGLVGRVVEAGRYSSKVLLITDPNSKVGVLIERNGQGGILTGMPGGRCRMIYIALDSDASPGDKVLTAGFGSVFPKGILAGEIVKIDKEPGRLYKYAVIKTAEDFSRLEEVLCIK